MIIDNSRILFANRRQAGQILGKKIKKLKLENPIVAAIAGGGVLVGKEIAKILNCPLKVVTVQKIFFPFEKSLGFGAVGINNYRYLSSYSEGVPPVVIKKQTEKAFYRLAKKNKFYSHFLVKNTLRGKRAILVDDALATGSTMKAAIVEVKKYKPARLIIASPAASAQSINMLKEIVSRLIYLYRHPINSQKPVSIVYKNYPTISKSQILKILNHAQNRLS